MVECDRIPYMSLVDWIVHNLKVYAIEVGAEDATYLSVLMLGDYVWDKILLSNVDGEPMPNWLIKECIDNPFTRDEDAWNEYMQCIEEKLYPLFKKLEPGLRQTWEAMKEALKH